MVAVTIRKLNVKAAHVNACIIALYTISIASAERIITIMKRFIERVLLYSFQVSFAVFCPNLSDFSSFIVTRTRNEDKLYQMGHRQKKKKSYPPSLHPKYEDRIGIHGWSGLLTSV